MPISIATASQGKAEVLSEIRSKPLRKIPYPKNEPSETETPNSIKISSFFGLNVFGLVQLQSRLPKPVFENLVEQMSGNRMIDRPTADAVAHAASVWAMSRGATHYSHWFQPLTNSTAEKHDAFLTINYLNLGNCMISQPIDSFSGSQLIQAEPDASSFPNGGVRSTFEARGYTVWDTTSPMFLHEGPHGTMTLLIPSIFISYNGDALDEKTILLRSCDAVSDSAISLLRLVNLDNGVKRINATLGTEQEFFLVDRGLYSMRPDLKMCGRTLIGRLPPKHQQLEDHYFANIPSRALAAIGEAELELWKLGVPVKTRHNEVAPQQFEIAPIFEEASVAVDHNLLIMETLGKVAHRYGLKALFHEKPFAGINGSGKHCNWSLATDSGINLLEPTENPDSNIRFLLVLSGVLLAVKNHGGLLGASIASSSNEHRLGANEAPPAIISCFLGEQLSEILNSISENRDTSKPKLLLKRVMVGSRGIDVHIPHLPDIRRDATDRNRTSPLAFTGDKFEFRAVGSSQSPSFPVAMLNSAVAASFIEIEGMIKERMISQKSTDVSIIMRSVIKEVIIKTSSVRFEGDNYSGAWVEEAQKRGLPNLANAPMAFREIVSTRNSEMLTKTLDIFNETEINSRHKIMCTRYFQDLLIEAKTIRDIAQQHIYPATLKYRSMLNNTMGQVESMNSFDQVILEKLNNCVKTMGSLIQSLDVEINNTETQLDGNHNSDSAIKACEYACKNLKPVFYGIRESIDEIEKILSDELYPFPKYSEILFS